MLTIVDLSWCAVGEPVGLGDADKCCDLKANLVGKGLHILCLQETKLSTETCALTLRLSVSTAPSSTQHGPTRWCCSRQLLPRPTSDHVPLMVTSKTTAHVSATVRYEKGWALDPEFQQLVADVCARP